jgi:hypothetical protein
MRYVLQVILASIFHHSRRCSYPEILLRAAPQLPQLVHTIVLRNPSREPLRWHSRQFSLPGTKSTRKLSKLEFGLRTTQVPSLVVPSCTSCRASFTETDTTWDLRCLFPLANLQEGKWCSLSSTSSYSACFLTVPISCLSALQVFTWRLLHLLFKRHLPQGRAVYPFAADHRASGPEYNSWSDWQRIFFP